MAEHHPDLALADLATSEEHAAASLLSVTAQWSDPTFSAQFDDGTAWVPWRRLRAGFFAHGVVRACDLVGDGADAAFASALAVVATRADLLLALVVSADHLARGILTLRYHKHGAWRHVTIDTALPCTAGGGVRFCRAATTRECFPSLLQKGYAKLHGGYAAARGGCDAGECLIDLTGGLLTRRRLPARRRGRDVGAAQRCARTREPGRRAVVVERWRRQGAGGRAARRAAVHRARPLRASRRAAPRPPPR